jgi:hypothetical protein
LEGFCTALLGSLGVRGVYLDAFADTDYLCYDSTHGHLKGAGNYWVGSKLAVASAARASLPTGSFIAIESPNENYLTKVDIAVGNVGDNFPDLYITPSGSPPSTAFGCLSVPLFQTVYHDFILSTSSQPINFPSGQNVPGTASFLSTDSLVAFRCWYAAHLFSGRTPFGGTMLLDSNISNNFSIASKAALFPAYANFISAVRNYLRTMRYDLVRYFTTFAQRMRDPIVTSPSLVSIADSASDFYKPYQIALGTTEPRIQPAVYGSTYQDPFTGYIGVLLINWTDPTDNSSSATPPVTVLSGSIGDQVVSISLDIADYIESAPWLAPNGVYHWNAVTCNDCNSNVYPTPPNVISSTLTVNSSGLAQISNLLVPSKSAVFFYISP